MKAKTFRPSIIFFILYFTILTLWGCGQKPAERVLPEIITEDTAIVFSDPIVEKEVRRILEKPTGDIFEKELLEITAFGIDEIYDDLSNVGKFGCINDPIETLEDLKWLKNLKVLVLSDCNIKSLDGIENLNELELLYVYRNKITSLEPVRNLNQLRFFDCVANEITDYTALSGLVQMEKLCIGGNGMGYTDLSPLASMTQLKSLYASWCGISDISPLQNMSELEFLQLHNNNVSDISILEHLLKLQFLGLELNRITDIEPISRLPNLETLYIDEKLIPREDLDTFYAPKEEDYFITIFQESINQELPPFTFELRAWKNRKMNAYSLDTLTISNDSDLYETQVISLPELSFFGQTAIPMYQKDTMGVTFEDVNFDGYEDIRLFDTSNGNYLLEWIYLVWNQEKALFEHVPELSEIPLASFDQEKKLIYGMERGSAVSHYYSTYQYIGGLPVMIRYDSEQGMFLDEEQIKMYFGMASIKEEPVGLMSYYETESVRDEDTGQMKVIRDEIVFYSDSEAISADKIIAKIPADSDTGRAILNRE